MQASELETLCPEAYCPHATRLASGQSPDSSGTLFSFRELSPGKGGGGDGQWLLEGDLVKVKYDPEYNACITVLGS